MTEIIDCLLSPEQAADAIGWRENPQILFSCGLVGVQVGDRTFVRASDLRAWLKSLRKAVAREVAGFENVRRHVAEAEAAE
jgi:hypothetical protein